jgi:hypothetical protein
MILYYQIHKIFYDDFPTKSLLEEYPKSETKLSFAFKIVPSGEKSMNNQDVFTAV